MTHASLLESSMRQRGLKGSGLLWSKIHRDAMKPLRQGMCLSLGNREACQAGGRSWELCSETFWMQYAGPLI